MMADTRLSFPLCGEEDRKSNRYGWGPFSGWVYHSSGQGVESLYANDALI